VGLGIGDGASGAGRSSPVHPAEIHMLDQDKRQRIMQAAEKLFASRRFHEITTDEVAHEAKVGKGTIYRFFRDKEDLFFETANSGFDELCDLLREKVSQEATFSQQILQACVEINRFFVRRRELCEMMQSQEERMCYSTGPMKPRWLQKRKRLVDALAGILASGVQEGAVRSDIPPEVLANFLLGMLRTRARDLQDYPEGVRRFEVVTEMFFRGAGHDLAPAGRNGRKEAGPDTE
jgi:AcrR family transcriptional regulator